MSDTMSFQDMILRLLDYWREQGCLVWQPYNVQVGAGTLNPATTLRVLGPEPWNVVYVEPSIRPDDGRFGDNPNRMQQHTQLQVILQPDPGNPQELYLKSLEAIGINPRQHDIRFVEDNWESPAFGAWGLGWEVWLDGQEITQFTYFQQAGSINLDPVAVEITYGLDRIALALQRVAAVWEIDYGAGINYGDLLLQQEIEQCRYYFDLADVDALRQVYDTYEREAARCLAAGLVATAHDYNLKCSHIFNVLDTRGAVGVTERADYFRRMRSLARQYSELYLEQRQRLEYPLLENPRWQTPDVRKAAATTAPDVAQLDLATAATFVLEIGSEELPVGDLTGALAQLRELVPALLAELRLDHGQIQIDGTPRRLAVIVHELAARQADLTTEVKGPPADRAFDPAGQPTKAAEGFARSRGVRVDELKVVEEGGKRYVAAAVHESGRPALHVLAEALPNLIASLKFGKSMRWNRTNVAYSRPLRWIVALFGATVVPFSYAGVVSGRTSRGLRPYDSPEIVIDTAASYRQLMAAHGIVVELDKRRGIVTGVARQLAAEQGGTIPEDEELVLEVSNLVERPTPFVGQFEARFLALPAEVLVAVMRKHQRYFPVYDAHGRLLPYFVAVRNGDSEHIDLVAEGNAHVIRARFADAEFFYNQDRKRPLADFVPDLATLTVHSSVGSMLDKTNRLVRLTPIVANMLGLSDDERATAVQAAGLAKADLVTKMVVEMTSLQGIMGGIYARLSGEPEPVAAAIAEQYNAISQTRPGLALALADRIDSLVSLFAGGLAPKGSNDPFALRRAAIQVIENLVANEEPFDLAAAFTAAGQLLPADLPLGEAVLAEVLAFVNGRLEATLQEQGIPTSVVRAVLAEQGHDPYGAAQAGAALAGVVAAPDWPPLLDAYARCVRITRGQPAYRLDAGALATPAEQTLHTAYQAAAERVDGTVDSLVAAIRHLEPAITGFFDNVMVMSEDEAERENRLALLQQIAGLASGIADLSQLEGF